jgi:tetrahydromethanopterin S-methyltransferase subunit G
VTDNVENLMFEHLKRFQSTLERMDRRQEEIIARLANLEGQMVAVMQHLANFSAADAAQQISIDNINMRLDRIERRLELTS